MKSTFFNQLTSRLTLLSILLAGLFLFAPDQAQAQQMVGGNYVSEATAKTRIQTELADLKSQLGSLPHGSLNYNKALWKYEFYELVLYHLNEGKTVRNSVELGYSAYNTDKYADMPAAYKRENRAELQQILS